MKPFLIQQLERYALRLTELDFLLSREDIMADMTQFLKLSREHAEVSAVASRFARFQQRSADLTAAKAMLDDEDMREMAEEEASSASAELQSLEAELQRMLLPKDPDDARPAFVEIRAGTGGDESALFASDLLRMYTRFAESQGWQCEMVSESMSELGGYKEATPPTCASTPTAPAERAGSTSTRPILPCASPTCPPASWPNARTAAASTATRPRP